MPVERNAEPWELDDARRDLRDAWRARPADAERTVLDAEKSLGAIDRAIEQAQLRRAQGAGTQARHLADELLGAITDRVGGILSAARQIADRSDTGEFRAVLDGILPQVRPAAVGDDAPRDRAGAQACRMPPVESPHREPTDGGAVDKAKLDDLVLRIADCERNRTEDDLQADIQTFLLWGGLDLDEDDVRLLTLESQVGDGTRRRIDIEIGSTAIETKKRLKTDKDVEDASAQLAQYVVTRTEQTGRRYAGIITDSRTWRLLNVRSDGSHEEVSRHDLSPEPEVARLVAWLEGVLVTSDHIKPTPAEVSSRLGAESTGYKLDLATLRDLYESRRRHPEVLLKRQLWAKALVTALGTQFTDDDDLFVQHTYLVNVAEIIAHAAIGFRIEDPSYSAAQLPERLALQRGGHPRSGRVRLLRLGGRRRRGHAGPGRRLRPEPCTAARPV